MKYLSAAHLEKLGACENQVQLFRKFLGARTRVKITVKNLQLAINFGLDHEWARRTNLLTEITGMVEWANGSRAWWVNGLRHREDGPALVKANGDREWWVNGRLHREDGPAVVRANGDRAWWMNGRLHREDGPAIEWDQLTVA